MEKTLGMIIAEHRKEKGMTQLELAEKMGIAVIVLSVLDALPVESGITLLGIGMTCIGISLFNNKG